MSTDTGAYLLGLCLGVALGAVVGWKAHGEPRTAVIETPAPAVHYADGSVLAERAPGAKPTLPAPTKPKGSTVIRTEEVTILPKAPEPKPEASAKECLTPADMTCPPVRLRLDVLETADSTIRVAAKTEDGTITAFKDIPYRPAAAPMRRHIALIVEPQDDRHSILAAKDYGRLSIGAGIQRSPDTMLPVLVAGWSW